MLEPAISKAPAIYSRSEHSISRSSLDPDALKIMYRLIRHGHKAYLVGGGVRDLLLNKKPKDYDIATDATPRIIKSLFRNSRVIGRRFKLVHIFFGSGKIIQVSTFRDFSDPIDAQDDHEAVESRPPAHHLITDNKYGSEATDAQRRDLTINGLFYDLATFSIIDYVGGMEDLREGIIRVIGDPDQRFQEDPVRMIRVVRHAARAGFVIEPNTYTAIARNRELLATCSTMRIFEEVKKDLLSGSCLPIFRLLAQSSLLDLLLPELTVHDWHLLSERSRCAAILKHADRLIQSGETITAAPLLAIIALFTSESAPVDEGNPIARFTAPGEIAEHVAACFSGLAVPKKEREKVEDILFWWHGIKLSGKEARLGTLARMEVYPELCRFAELLNANGSEEESLAIVLNPSAARREAASERMREHPQGARRRRPRRRHRHRRHETEAQ
jgi:poly(A) polymerase